MVSRQAQGFLESAIGPILEQSGHMIHEHELPVQIRAEYLEMPGLQLSVGQAARLWNTDACWCSAALEGLVENGFLCKKDSVYLLARSGRRNA